MQKNKKMIFICLGSFIVLISGIIVFNHKPTINTDKYHEESKEEISNIDYNTFQDIRKSIENLSQKEQVINILENELKKGIITDYEVSENYITYNTIFGIRGIWEDGTLFSEGNKNV